MVATHHDAVQVLDTQDHDRVEYYRLLGQIAHFRLINVVKDETTTLSRPFHLPPRLV